MTDNPITQEATHFLDGKLEEASKDCGDQSPLYSIAISLKRIADALHGDDQNEGMKHAISNIADRMHNQ